jgi:RNA recognition motif-containing protein
MMKNLFVGNMSFQTTESDLRALFEPFGQITRIHVVQDRETGQPRGFAFVEIADDAEAAKAISALDGKEVAGRALKVNEARPRPDGGGGGSRGGGFRNGGRDRY